MLDGSKVGSRRRSRILQNCLKYSGDEYRQNCVKWENYAILMGRGLERGNVGFSMAISSAVETAGVLKIAK